MSNTPRTSITSLNITFLGTASAQPSSTRNHSSLALRLNGDVWLFDCGEATQHQIQRSSVKMGRIEKVFITHTHGDHIFGLLPVMAGCLNGAGGTAEGSEDPRLNVDTLQAPFEIYGPMGTRAYVRNGLYLTHTRLERPYVVHELRFPQDPQTEDYTALSPLPFEEPGKNILQVNGIWQNIFQDNIVSVSAAPIKHSVPCVGYVVTEASIAGKVDPALYIPHLNRTKTPRSVMRQLQQGERIHLSDGTVLEGPAKRKGRKIVILGDTYDASPIVPIAGDSDLLIHEATNAHLPGIDDNTKETDTYETVEATARSRGHSTPQIAGAFARKIRAQKLVLNHFSARYAGNDTEEANKIMNAIARLAGIEYKGEIICARDFMSFDIQHNHE
ncbi:beta-lactamase-like protein [Cyathus striatus]|nr:beta-lactamase-like protein [Cyathus striatus]